MHMGWFLRWSHFRGDRMIPVVPKASNHLIFVCNSVWIIDAHDIDSCTMNGLLKSKDIISVEEESCQVHWELLKFCLMSCNTGIWFWFQHSRVLSRTLELLAEVNHRDVPSLYVKRDCCKLYPLGWDLNFYISCCWYTCTCGCFFFSFFFHTLQWHYIY